MVTSVCGTEADPQEMSLQVKILQEAGVLVFHSNTQATTACCKIYSLDPIKKDNFRK